MNTTLQYYDSNADEFVKGTISVDFKGTQDKFLEKLESGASILDFGCGSGRDTKYFLSQGFKVDAVDGSEELCKRAEAYTNIVVNQLLFQELNEENKYDGIWACSSILHLSKYELIDVFQRMLKALRKNGIIYTSFKYGTYEGIRNGRYFTDFTIESFEEFIGQIKPVHIETYWITSDARPSRGDEKWLNVILRKE